ncbi:MULTISPECIES: Bug family tripartite tricarboxylate transporter substrate binding protein [Polaromonas]|uniref:Bug family tripartite tricarboxylate transporter substrate binding protein n=1 Tax=Polaromonas aquatica TaxID=332657 RepID=A0ABW1TYW4_9BURK
MSIPTLKNFFAKRLLPRTSRVAAICGLLLGAGGAFAAYPDKPITLVVPFAPGGSSDIVARNLAPMLGERLGQSVIIDNVSGAGGLLGTQRTIRAAPDGYTILLGSGSEILINKLINPALAYDGIKDLAPAVFVGTGPMVLVGKPGLPANNVTELLALAHAKPGVLSYASAGNGTPMHVAGELLKMRANIFMTHIPYRGAAPALVDLIGGQIDLGVSTLSAAQPYIKSGKIKAYAVTSAKPSELAPGIPALGMVRGLEGFDLGVWFGLFMPAKTPPEILQKVQAAAQQVLADPAIRKKLAEQGISASGASADELRKFMATEVEKYRAVVKAAKITGQ